MTCVVSVNVDSAIQDVFNAIVCIWERGGLNSIQTFSRVRLDKTIPRAAGLGGGSSNAATANVNELTGRPCSTEELADFGAEFGSDISFFLSQGTAYCTGSGEIMEDVASLGSPSLFIVKSPEGLSTPRVFKNMQLAECSDTDPLELLGW